VKAARAVPAAVNPGRVGVNTADQAAARKAVPAVVRVGVAEVRRVAKVAPEGVNAGQGEARRVAKVDRAVAKAAPAASNDSPE